MPEKCINLTAPGPVNMKKRRKNPSQLVIYPKHKSSLPPIHLPFIPSHSDRNTRRAEYTFPQYCPSHRYWGTKGKTNFKHTWHPWLLSLCLEWPPASWLPCPPFTSSPEEF